MDWTSVELGRERALSLFYKLKAGKITSLKTEDGAPAPETKVIETSASKINDLFGIEVKQSVMAKILKSLEFGVELRGDKIICSVPLFREDVDNYTDLAEEVIRFYGYDYLRSDLIKDAHPTNGGMTVRQKNLNAIRNTMTSFGCLLYTSLAPWRVLGIDKCGF